MCFADTVVNHVADSGHHRQEHPGDGEDSERNRGKEWSAKPPDSVLANGCHTGDAQGRVLFPRHTTENGDELLGRCIAYARYHLSLEVAPKLGRNRERYVCCRVGRRIRKQPRVRNYPDDPKVRTRPLKRLSRAPLPKTPEG